MRIPGLIYWYRREIKKEQTLRSTNYTYASRTGKYIGLRLLSQWSVANKSFFRVFVSPFCTVFITSYPDVCFSKTKEWFERKVVSQTTRSLLHAASSNCNTSQTWQNKLRSLVRWFHLSVETSILLQKSLSVYILFLKKGSIDFGEASSGFLRITLGNMVVSFYTIFPILHVRHISSKCTLNVRSIYPSYRGADKSLARPTFRCLRNESIVSLERDVCSCANLQVFSCYRNWMEACRATSEFSPCSLFPSWSG
jgi:hypothetical protein